ncbi:hypothetical protein BDN71DRAFT_1429563 [Pleurotus eryngii]|uniref:Uncharacterized protein n=1 Tax=Pleurotus eryngii TaxID=5323 RepID=A0A9P6A1K8_PLEER|nr:hypothetical protein BDN71DRAFT_1429563 [Pleurotus eryngii]
MEQPGEAMHSIVNTIISKLTGCDTNFISELIHSHPRVVYSIQEDCEVIISGLSSEPLVTEVAAIMMNSDQLGSEPMAVWHILAQYVAQGLMGQGNGGELLGCTISIMAMDQAISGCPTLAKLKYQISIEVNKYFEALLTDKEWKALRASVPANFLNLRKEDSVWLFEDAFCSTYVHFSHYSRARDSSLLNIDYLWALWIHGVAIQCHPRQEHTKVFM